MSHDEEGREAMPEPAPPEDERTKTPQEAPATGPQPPEDERRETAEEAVPAAPAEAQERRTGQEDRRRTGPEDRRFQFRKERRIRRFKSVLKVVGVLLVVGLAALIGLFEYSASPNFCGNCHIMQPYIKAWGDSSHKDVACVECHYPPGTAEGLIMKIQNVNQVVKYVTQTYGSKPYAEIEDASCLRSGCHSERLLKGKVKMKKGITFDHAPHVKQERRGRHLRCTSCHAQMVVGNHMEVTTSTCFLCHFKGQMTAREQHPLGGCQVCHTAPDWDIKVAGQTFSHKEYVGSKTLSCQNCHHDVAQGDGLADRDRCLDCHNEPEKLERFGDTKFLHEAHVTTHDVSCNRCHTEITHKLSPVDKVMEPSCSECHDKMHTAPRDLYLGQGGKGVPTMPGHMFLAQVDCVACHTKPKNNGHSDLAGQTYVASDAMCSKCHGDSYRGMVGDWKKAFQGMLGQINPREEALRKAVGGLPAGTREEATSKLDEARHNIDMVEVGRGLHNPFYASELLHAANDMLDGVAEMTGKDPKPLPADSPITQGSCATLCHARAGVKPPQIANLRGAKLPHADHQSYGLHCSDCHSQELHRQLRRDFVNCSSCHHSMDKPSCGTCHTEQADFYNGKLRNRTLPPNPMGEAMACDMCHPGGERPDTGKVSEACLTCHEESYGNMPAAWAEQGAKSLAEAKAALAGAREAVEALPLGRREDLGRKLSEVERTLEQVDRAKTIHNPDGAREALRWVTTTLAAVREQATRSVGDAEAATDRASGGP